MNATKPRPVLFLDDERSYVAMMTELLSGHLDCPIVPFTRPQDALAALPSLDPGMIVTDFSMPLINGIDFLCRARATGSSAPAIMITGHQIELGGRDLSQVPGLQATLFKPVTWRQLADQIIRHWPDRNPPAIKANGTGGTAAPFQ